MANGVHLLTGHQSTNHITASEEAAYNAALVADRNCVIATDKNVSLTVLPASGSVTVGTFTALFSGRRVSVAGASGTFTPAVQFRRVSIGLLYNKDTSQGSVEDCSLAVYCSSECGDAGTAAGASTGVPLTTRISANTTSAYFELFDLVVGPSAVQKRTDVYEVLPSFGDLAEMYEQARMHVNYGYKSGENTAGIVFSFGSQNIQEYLMSIRMSLIQFYKASSPSKSVTCLWCLPLSASEPPEQESFPTVLTVGNSNRVLTFRVVPINDGADLQLKVGTVEGGATVQRSEIPYDALRIFSWR